MKPKFFRSGSLCLALVLGLVSVATGYDLITDEGGYIVTWPSGSIPFQIKLATSPGLTDGTAQSDSVQAAMQTWNGMIGLVQFSSTALGPGTTVQGNHVNEIAIASTVDGEAFGSGVLAVTVSWTNGGNTRVESDIVFNSAYTWDSYRGNLRSGVQDIRRVALHELGHVLGLDHPDEAGQSVTAIMNSHVSNIDALQTDDINGARSMYGAPGSFPPTNNNFASAATIFLSSGSTQVTGTNVAATAEGGEPAHGGETATRSVWWRWTPTSNGTVAITTLGSNFDTTLGVYTGSAVSALNVIASNDDVQDGVIRTSTASFAVTSGITYFIAVDGWGGYMGSIKLNLSFTPAAIPPTITSQPVNRTVTAGTTAQFSISVSGTPTPTLQWYRLPATGGNWILLTNGGSYSGVTSTTLFVSGTTPAMNGDQFSCVASNPAGSVSSNFVTLTVTSTAPNITGQPVNATVAAGATASFIVSASGNPTPSYQWYRLPAGSGTWILLTNGGGYSGATTNVLSIATALAMNGDRFSCSVSNVAGTVVSTLATLAVTAAIPPSLTNWPFDTSISLGSSLSLSLSGANGTAPFTYQWFKDGVAIQGATNSSLFKALVSVDDAGAYSVQVSNAAGVVTSPDITVSWTTNSSSIPWLDAYRLGNVVYFLAANPGRIMRYDIVQEIWLPMVLLTSGQVPSAFLPTDDGIFIAYGSSVVRRPLDLQSELAVASTGTNAKSLFSFGNLVYFQDGSNVRSFNRATLAAGPSFPVAFWTSFGGFTRRDRPVFANSLNRGFTAEYLSPSDIVRFTVAGDGTFTSESDGPYHGDFSIGTRQYLTPGEQLIIDNSGVVYRTSDLTYATALGGAFDDLVFLDNGSTVILRGSVLSLRTGDNFVETGRYILPTQSFSIFTQANAVFAFGTPQSSLQNPPVTKVPVNTFGSVTPSAVFNPVNTRFSVEDLFIDGNGVIHLLTRSGRGVVRWDAQHNGFLSTLPIRGGAAVFSYASAVNRYVLGYSDGTLTQFQLGVDGVERAFANHPARIAPYSAVAMDNLTVLKLQDGQSSGHARIVLGSSGETLFNDGGGLYFGDGLAWSSSNRRLYSTPVFSTTALSFETVPTTGVLPGQSGLTAAVTLPIRLSGDETTILSADGKIYNADLGLVGTVANPVLDGVWLPDGLCTVRATASGTEVQKWASVSYAFGLARNLPGRPLRIFKLSDTRLAVVTVVDGYVAFHVLAADLSVVSSGVNNGALTRWVDLELLPQPLSIAVLPGANASFALGANSSLSDAISYRWQVLRHSGGGWTDVADGGQYSGAHSSMLRLTNCAFGDDRDQYRCIVMNSARTITSSAVTLYVVNSLTDFNGDGKGDLLWRSTSTGQVAVWFMDGALFAGSASLGFVSQDWKSAGVGDFNGDGKADLLWRSTSTGQVAAWFMDGASFAGSASLGFVSNDWQNAGVGDFNGDGRSDLLWRSASTGEVAVWFMNGPNFLSSASLGYVSPDWKSIGVVDFNHDGKTDLLWRSTSTGQVAVWYMDGATFLGSASLGFVATDWQSAGVGDYNNDGKPDLLWRSTSTGQVAIWFMDGATFLSSASMGFVSTDWQIMR